jgi:uncharacterized protein (TIGR02588 family)
MSDEQRDGSHDHARNADPGGATAIELVATAVAAALVLGIVVILLWDAVHPNSTPSFRARLVAVSDEGAVVRATLDLRNNGDDAAKAVVVHVRLVATPADTTLDETDVTIDWLPGRASRHVVALLPTPPESTSFNVRADVRGYVVP